MSGTLSSRGSEGQARYVKRSRSAISDGIQTRRIPWEVMQEELAGVFRRRIREDSSLNGAEEREER
jgi:hypothetical protein